MLVFWSNYARTGNILNSGYEIDFSTPLLTGLYGLLFSSGKSVFLFSPILLLYAYAAAELWRDAKTRWLVSWSLALLVGQFLFVCKWWDWSGDDSWGPRLVLFSTTAALVVVAASSWASSKWFAALAALGFIVQLPAMLMGPITSVMIDHSRKITYKATWPDETVPVTLDDVRFNPSFSQVTNTTELLLFKIAPGWKCLSQTQWLSGMTPPLAEDQVKLDIFWFRLKERSAPVTPNASQAKSRISASVH